MIHHYKSVLAKHGYSKQKSPYTNDTGYLYFKHPDAPDHHVVSVSKDGNDWEHFAGVDRATQGNNHHDLDKHLTKYHSSSQHAEAGDMDPDSNHDDSHTPGNVTLSKHHKHLRSKGYRFTSTGNNGWTAHYEHPESGRQARIEFHSGSDEHGTLHGVKPASSSQHAEEDAPDYNPHFVYGGGVVAPPVPMSREKTTTQHSEQPSPPQVSSFGAGVRY